MNTIKVLLFGDLVGSPGRLMFKKHARQLQQEMGAHFIIVNGENSAHGKGITSKIVAELKNSGADCITTGNHIWDKKDIIPYLKENNDVLRPLNYPESCPGPGSTVIEKDGIKIGIINAMGNLFMKSALSCPFMAVKKEIAELKKITPLIFVDFHAEATSEKLCMGYVCEGLATGVVGTHTHIQTADARVLPEGTGYITDLGMAGSLNSMIGVKKEAVINAFLTQMPIRHEVADNPPFVLSGICIEADSVTGKAINVKSIYIVDEQI